jgi:hypothetical protein
MFVGISFGAMVRGFGDAFVGAFLFGGMVAVRVFRVEAWMGDGAVGGEMSGGVLVEKMYTFGMCG